MGFNLLVKKSCSIIGCRRNVGRSFFIYFFRTSFRENGLSRKRTLDKKKRDLKLATEYKESQKVIGWFPDSEEVRKLVFNIFSNLRKVLKQMRWMMICFSLIFSFLSIDGRSVWKNKGN